MLLSNLKCAADSDGAAFQDFISLELVKVGDFYRAQEQHLKVGFWVITDATELLPKSIIGYSITRKHCTVLHANVHQQ